MPEFMAGNTFEPSGPSKGNVLVVDDDPDTRAHLRSILTPAGFGVTEVSTGEEAVDAMHTGDNPLLVEAVVINVEKSGAMDTVAYFNQQFPSIAVIATTGFPTLHESTDQRTQVAIVGGGRGGSALLDLFRHLPGVEIVGVTDKDAQAPALNQARDWGIPVVQDALSLIAAEGINLIVDVTGDPGMARIIAEHKRAGAEVLGGAAAKLLWNVVQYEGQMQAHLARTERLADLMRAGVITDYMLKPVKAENLLGSLAKSIERRELHSS